MLDDMRARKLAPKTQSHYLRAVRQFARYLGRSPDSANVEDLRNYQLHLVDQGTSGACALRGNVAVRCWAIERVSPLARSQASITTSQLSYPSGLRRFKFP